jgi:peroxygenase
MALGLMDALDPFPDKDNHEFSFSPKSEVLIERVGDSINHWPPGKPYTVCIKDSPITVQRLPYWPKRDDRLVDPGTARANFAASNETPTGTHEANWADRHEHMTVMQQHCSYWDQDGDGVIWPLDTYRGCRAWGWNIILSALAMVIINGALSYPTVSGLLPDPFFRIYIKNIHKDKHGSDSMTYDNEGRFRYADL